jgi:peptide deformylase
MDNAHNKLTPNTLKIVKLGSDILRQKAAPVTVFGPELEETVAQMIVLLKEAKGVGLAAPQVGIGERFFVIHAGGEAPLAFINPTIIETSADTVACEEGCLSLPGVQADIIRPAAVKVQAFDTKGRPFTIECSGIVARVIQHENDHLDGILFYDRLSELKQERLLEKYKKIAGRGLKPNRKNR